MTSRLIERIEGEAVIDFALHADTVTEASIRFEHFRGMEAILRGRPAMDALVVTPRVCGICGHAHLQATVRAIEAAYARAGDPVQLTVKAQQIRELTLMLEVIQNHLKWFYLVILRELYALGGESAPQNVLLKGAYAASLANKASAFFSGQWPHSSYAIPGGVTCDPTHLDLVRAQNVVDTLAGFLERETLGIDLDGFESLTTCKALNALHGDLTAVDARLMAAQMQHAGHAYDRFIVLGEHVYAQAARLIATAPRKVDPERIGIEAPHLLHGTTQAKNVLYKAKHYEVGPLARAIAMDYPLIKNMHRRFKDAAYTRVMARIYETVVLVRHVRRILGQLELSEPSYVAPTLPIKALDGEGTGIVEAPRGPLLHRVRIEGGVIAEYAMITPTQWNLGSGPAENRGTAQAAMIGQPVAAAEFIFRTFDVCSVCTTH